jgi:hypothetical protein
MRRPDAPFDLKTGSIKPHWRIPGTRGKLSGVRATLGSCCVHEKVYRRTGAVLYVGGL